MSKYIPLRIALTIDKETELQALKFAADIGKLGKHLFRLDDKHFPHITLYKAEYPVENIKIVSKSLEKISKLTKVLELKPTGFFGEWGYVGIGITKTLEIIELHHTVLNAFNYLRKGYLKEKYNKEISEGIYSNEEISNIKKYGNPYVDKLYEPHISLLKFHELDIGVKIAEKYNNTYKLKSGFATELILADDGEYGSVQKIRNKFSLKE